MLIESEELRGIARRILELADRVDATPSSALVQRPSHDDWLALSTRDAMRVYLAATYDKPIGPAELTRQLHAYGRSRDREMTVGVSLSDMAKNPMDSIEKIATGLYRARRPDMPFGSREAWIAAIGIVMG